MTPLDFSQTEKPRQIAANLIAYMRLFDGLPGMTFSAADSDVFWIASGTPAPGDMMIGANLPAESAELQIDTLFAQIGQHIDEVGWMVFPGDLPANLGQRLEARGMPGGPAGNWLWASLDAIKPGPVVPDDFRIERVRDDAMMAEWVRVSEAGFGMELGCFYDAYARHGYGSDGFSLHYTGYLGDVPVTSATLLDAGGWASLYDISTPPEFRGQGFGRAITVMLLRELQGRGYSDTWIWSSNMAKGVYESLGFVDADFGIREYTWRKNA